MTVVKVRLSREYACPAACGVTSLINVGTENLTTTEALDAFARQMHTAPLAENLYALVTMLWFENE